MVQVILENQVEKDTKHWLIFLLRGTIQFLIYFYSTLSFSLSAFWFLGKIKKQSKEKAYERKKDMRRERGKGEGRREQEARGQEGRRSMLLCCNYYFLSLRELCGEGNFHETFVYAKLYVSQCMQVASLLASWYKSRKEMCQIVD